MRTKTAQIIQSRLSTVVAAVFAAYSLGLFGHSIWSWRLVVEEQQQYLIEDARRRVIDIINVLQAFREESVRQSNNYEIKAYLQNRDLGMSVQYGLGASLRAVEQAFQEHLANEPHTTQKERIVYFAPDGSVLADTSRGSPLPHDLMARLDGVYENLLIAPDEGLLLIRQPVTHKDDSGGKIVVIHTLDHLLQHLLHTGGKPWRELLVGPDGKEIVFHGERPLPGEVMSELSDLPSGRVSTVQGPLAEWSAHDEVLVVKLQMPIQGLQFVKFVSTESVYGHIPPNYALIVAGVLPLFLLIGAIHLDRVRTNTERLKTEYALSNQQRTLVEQRNQELSAEIERREMTEQALKASEERWALAVSGANDGIWDWDPATGYAFYSDRWKSLLGYRPEEIANRIAEKEERIHPEDKPNVDIKIYRHMNGESDHYQCEYRMRRKDGSYIWVLDRGRVLLNERDRPVRVTGSLSDISERRAAEFLVDEHNRQLSAIFANSPDGMVSFDEDNRVLFVNPTFLQMTHLEQANLSGLSDDRFSETLAAICTLQMPFRGMAALESHPRSNGARELIELTVAGKPTLEVKLIVSKSAKVPRILFFHDVTHETEVNRMKSEFLSTAAHELRTPMASVYGYAELLLQPSFDETMRREFAQTIFKQAELMASIINELLDLARIEARRGKDFVIERIDLQDFLADSIASYKPPDNRDRPNIEFNGARHFLRADRKKLQQTVNNILSNAYKYSPEGGPVEVDVICEGRRSGIRVRDHGIGMTRQQLARVFERFYRADTSGAIPGTGLGMSIVKEIVELHGGEVAVESEEGVGSTVMIWMPNADEAA